jgi:hypothetical protein
MPIKGCRISCKLIVKGIPFIQKMPKEIFILCMLSPAVEHLNIGILSVILFVFIVTFYWVSEKKMQQIPLFRVEVGNL